MPKGCKELIAERTVESEVFADMDNFDLVNNPTAFAKSLRLQFPKFSKGFSSSDFEEFVQEHVGVENLKSLGRLHFPNEWQMEVESKDVREKLIRCGKTKIKNRSCWISPLCSSEIRGFVHWLPNTISNQKVKDLLSEYGEVLFVENQKQPNWDLKVDSDSRYYALYLRAGKAKEDLPHFAKIEDFDVLVTVRGRNPSCFHCREYGHRKNECKKYKAKLKSYCHRPTNTAGKRKKPRGKRFAEPPEASEDDPQVPETEENVASSSGTETKTVASSSGAKQKTSAESKAKVTSEKQQEKKKTDTNPRALPEGLDVTNLAQFLTDTLSTFLSQPKADPVPTESPAEPAEAAAEGEKKKRKKKKKNKKKSEKQEESVGSIALDGLSTWPLDDALLSYPTYDIL